VIVSDKYKVIFIRIPKTGSTSVEDALIKADPDCLKSDNDKSPYGHFSAQTVKELYHIGDYRWNNYFKFCTVREPLDWYMSMYLDHVRHPLMKFGERMEWFFKNKEGRLPFSESTKELDLDAMLMLNTLNTKWYGPADCSLQVDWLNAGPMDLVIDFKEINKGWDLVKKKTGITIDLEKHNEGPIRKKNQDVVFSKEAKEVFSIIHSKDIEFYKNLNNKK
tara:strand:+ start:1350 stop:2009 length:660 start_codon:yes stop_codon:yes gene_type:complete